MPKPHFILYGRSYCHLCDDMLQALLALRGPDEHSVDWFTVDVIDVDGDTELVARYDELVPVLVGCADDQPQLQLCHYFLDVEQVRGFLAG
ncbi:hypothetical protein CAter10_1646 [Collimonas arenae]|uniref:glutaredoxin family protein n=1 Tax=Collimonas arenae TaxID=279058 RepID=UPI0007785F2A|nr:glutaredoxin family protein [Collimonas arenae]AMO99410.1 hypothetical protein CAter10_1646 [Collimonas arenae]